MDTQESSGSPRALTRRELRALDAARQAEPDQPEQDQAEQPEPEPHEAAATTGGTTWSDDVRWSLHGELPRELPPEPFDDDVRWDQDTVPLHDLPTVSQPSVATDEATQAMPVVPPRVSAWAADAPAGEPEDAQLESDEPVPVSEPEAEPHADLESAESHEPELHEPESAELEPADADVEVGPHLTRPDLVAAMAFPDDGFEPAGVPPWQAVAEAPPAPAELPTLHDLLATRPEPAAGPAESGWQGTVRRLTGGLLAIRPGPAEQRYREAVATVQRSLDGPRTIVVINPKGGAHKTTATLLLAATFGQHRGGYTLAWDNNETRGTLGWRAQQAAHHNTAVNLLQDLDRFTRAGPARVGDLDNYVRSQGSAQFDVLASDEDAASAASVDGEAFRNLHRTLARFYRIMIIDTGNNMRASNWQAAVEAADQVVIVSTVREDTAQSAAWAIDALRATGKEDAVRRAVTVLSDPAPRRDPGLAERLHEHFGKLTRVVVDVPYDRSLVGGTPLEFHRLNRTSREAWLRVASAVAEGL